MSCTWRRLAPVRAPWLATPTMLTWWLLSPLLALAGPSGSYVTARNVAPLDLDVEDCTTKERGLNSFLWTIRRSPPAYLFGTIHVPYDRVWDYIPDNSKTAFSDSDSAIFELDLTNPYTLTALAECQMLPHGQILSDVLPLELYSRLQRHLAYVRTRMTDEADVKSRGIPVLDLYLAQQAEREGKVTGAVERVEEQCLPLNDLDLSQVIFALNQTLLQHEVMRDNNKRPEYSSASLIQHYNCGDLNSLMFNRDTTQVPALTNSSLSPRDLEKAELIERYFQDELIDKRNQRMAQRVAYLIDQHPHTSFFFAFGAGHFLGNKTVIDRLRLEGLHVEHTGPFENITRSNVVKERKPRKKSRKFVLSDDFPQPSDVIYGDIKYLFAKRIRPNKRFRKERRKLQRAKKRQEQQESLWSNIDPNTFYSHDRYSKSGNKRKKTRSRQNTFNDLWIRTEQISPRYLEQMGDTVFVHRPQTTEKPRRRVYWITYDSAPSETHTDRSLLLSFSLCAILLQWSRWL